MNLPRQKNEKAGKTKKPAESCCPLLPFQIVEVDEPYRRKNGLQGTLCAILLFRWVNVGLLSLVLVFEIRIVGRCGLVQIDRSSKIAGVVSSAGIVVVFLRGYYIGKGKWRATEPPVTGAFNAGCGIP